MKAKNSTLSIAIAIILLTAQSAYSQTSKIQFINNSPDIIVDTVDIWVNNLKIVDNLAFRKATQLLVIDSGYYDITIAKKWSTDTSSASSLFQLKSQWFDTSKTYVSFLSGVTDTNSYATNPQGIDRSLIVNVYDYSSIIANNSIDFYFNNGTIDANQFDLNSIGASAIKKLGNDVSFNSNEYNTILTGRLLLNLTSADSSKFEGAYQLNTIPFGGKICNVFTSGVYNALGNPNSAKPMQLFAAFSDGTVIKMVKLTSEIQLVNNSSDVTADSIDVYFNGVKSLSKVPFRTATVFLSVNASVPHSIAIALKGSTNVSEAFYTTSLTLDSSISYYGVFSGVLNTSQYALNPNGKNIAFKLHTYRGAKKVASISKNVELLYFHGATDLQTSTILGIGQVQFLSKNDSYGDFHGYGIHSAVDDIRFELRDAATDTIIKSAWFGNLASHKGSGGLAFLSGFKKSDATFNQNGDTMILFVAWPDGKVDSIAPLKPITGLYENDLLASDIIIYPNPTTNDINLVFDIKKETLSSILVTDISGMMIYKRQLLIKSGVNSLPIDLTNITASGIYLVNVQLGDQFIIKKINVIR